LENVRQAGDDQFLVRFEVKELASGALRRDSLIWTIAEGDEGVLLGFDANFMDIWESYFDLFARYNAHVTFFVQGEYGPFCNRALERGHDVGYHTLHHLNLPKVSREVFLEECFSSVDGFRNSGVPLRSFAYPFGLSEPWMNEILAGSFGLLRGYGTTFRIYQPDTIREGYITSKAIDNLLFKKDEEFELMIYSALRTVKFLGGGFIVPLTTHTIADDANWGIKPERLEFVLKTVNDLKLKWYLFSDFS
jgi:peptidoglycan/xylan/chitin deacetylase (PgdA/CDA1 family)